MIKGELENKYLVLIKLGGEVSKNKISEIAPKIKNTMDRLTNNKNKLFFTSGDGGSFGFFVKTNVTPLGIRKTLYGETNIIETACLSSLDDSVFITEILNDWTASGFSNGWSWLQHQ